MSIKNYSSAFLCYQDWPFQYLYICPAREREEGGGTLAPLKFSNVFVMEILCLLESISYVQIEENYVRNNAKGVTAYFSGAACG